MLSIFGLAISSTISHKANVILCIIIISCYLLSSKWDEKWLDIKSNKIYIISILLYTTLLLSIIYTSAPWPDIAITLKRNAKLLIITMAGYFIKTPRQQKIIIMSFLASISLNVLAIYFNQYLAFKSGVYIHFDIPNYPTPIYHIQAAIIYPLLFFICLLYCKENYKKNFLHFWILLILSLMSLNAIIALNVSRTGYIIVFSFINWACITKWKKIKGISYGFIISISLISFYFITTTSFHDRLMKVFSNNMIYQEYVNKENKKHKENKNYIIKSLNNSTAIRLLYLQNNLRIIKKAPIIGHGVGSINTEFYKTDIYKNKIRHTSEKFWDKECYNQFLNFYIQNGIIGAALYIFLLISIYKGKYSNNKSSYIAKGFVVIYFTGCLFNDYLIGYLTGYVFIVMAAYLASHIPKPQINKDHYYPP